VAAQFLSGELNSDELLATLDTYIHKGYYYYNLVVAIDRSLYSRIPMRESEQDGATAEDYLEFTELFKR